MKNIYSFQIILAIVLSLVPEISYAKKVLSKGIYRFGPNISENLACKLAFENAKKNALTKVVGEEIYSQDYMSCSDNNDNANCILNKSFISNINGNIKNIKKSEHVVEKRDGYSLCKIEIQANIKKPKFKKNPGIDFQVKLNKKIFNNNDDLKIFLKSTKELYFNIFQWSPNSDYKKFIKIFPNEIQQNNFLKREFSLPNNKYSFKTLYPKEVDNKKYIDEYLIILSSENNLKLLNDYSYENFQKMLQEIPNNQFRIKRINYEIIN